MSQSTKRRPRTILFSGFGQYERAELISKAEGMGLEVSYGISDSLDYFMAGPDVKAEKVRRANALCVPVIDDLDMALAGTLDFDHRPKPLVTWRAAIGLWVGVGLLWLFIQAIS